MERIENGWMWLWLYVSLCTLICRISTPWPPDQAECSVRCADCSRRRSRVYAGSRNAVAQRVHWKQQRKPFICLSFSLCLFRASVVNIVIGKWACVCVRPVCLMSVISSYMYTTSPSIFCRMWHLIMCMRSNRPCVQNIHGTINKNKPNWQPHI